MGYLLVDRRMVEGMVKNKGGEVTVPKEVKFFAFATLGFKHTT